ncbi:MAG: ATP-NAD kinase family protein [Thermoplasmatota archaeon]
MVRIAFVVNPIAGMGGKVGLKGTDGVIDMAIELGAEPRAPDRAREAVGRLAEAYTRHRLKTCITWFTAEGEMGQTVLEEAGIPQWQIEIVHRPMGKTTFQDTRETVRKGIGSGAELIVFCGGDGTARDVFGAAEGAPMFGIPSGVKMHSGVFALDPTTAGELLEFYIRGELTTGEGEIMDLDEDRYRGGEWNIALFGTAVTIFEPSFIQTGKFMVEEETSETSLNEIGSEIAEIAEEEPETIFILGPGGTLNRIGGEMGIDKTHLGVDITKGSELIKKDVTEDSILETLKEYDAGIGGTRKAMIIVSPIGGQGFFLGRGNLQIGPGIVRRVGIQNILVVSAPQKLERTKTLRVDTGDHVLDEEIRSKGSIKVLTGYRTFRLKKLS